MEPFNCANIIQLYFLALHRATYLLLKPGPDVNPYQTFNNLFLNK